jgi:hypothetical protein
VEEWAGRYSWRLLCKSKPTAWKEFKKKEKGSNWRLEKIYIMRNFIICALHPSYIYIYIYIYIYGGGMIKSKMMRQMGRKHTWEI